MIRRPLLCAALAQPLTTAEAVAAGLILPAGHRVGGRPVYASTGWTEELEAAGEADWAGAALLVAAKAAQRQPVVGRLRARWRVGGVRIPTAVVIQPRGGIVLVALDSE